MKVFTSNQELHEYLVALAAALRQRGAMALSDIVVSASHHASGLSTEFLGESRLALRQVLDQGKGVLTMLELADLTDVLRQLDGAFSLRETGGDHYPEKHHLHMNIGDIRFWRSALACWCLFGMFAVLTIVWQVVDVVPCPNMNRDWLIATIVFSTAAVVCFVLACHAMKRKKTDKGK